MPGTKSISEVKDLYDLIELYGSLDKNADGLLGSGEISAEEIKSGDRGGIGSANSDVRDGFLSPWEVAQMLGFKWEDVRAFKIANLFRHQIFPNIANLQQDIEIDGITYKAGTSLEFHPNGKVAQGTLAKDYYFLTSSDMRISAGSNIFFNLNGKFQRGVLASAASVAGVSCPVGSEVRFVESTGSVVLSFGNNPVNIDGIFYQEIAVSSKSKQQTRTLTRESSIPLTSSGILRVPLPAGHKVTVDGNLAPHPERLSMPVTINRIVCPVGTYFEPLSSETWTYGVTLRAPASEMLLFNGAGLRSVHIHGDGSIYSMDFIEPISITVGSLTIKVASIDFYPDRSVKSVKLAEDLPSPYGNRMVHRRGDVIFFLRNSALVEGSLEAFNRLFPHIKLSGQLNSSEIERIMLSLDELPTSVTESINGINFTYHNRTDDLLTTGIDEGINANPVNMTITLWKDHIPERSLFQHEAAHIFTYHQQRIAAQNIQRRTTNIDYLRYNSALQQDTDIVSAQASEELEVIRQEMARSFEGQWQRIVDDGGIVYGTVAKQKKNYRALVWISKDVKGEEEGPRYGFVRSYGSQDFYEDVATHVEMIWDNPELYRQLITPYSKFYEEHQDQRRYATVYRAKLELLHKYGFITEAKYREIVTEERKPKEQDIVDFCNREAVNCP